MPLFDALRLPSIQRALKAPVAPLAPAGALDAGELQIKILMPNNPAGQAFATAIFRAIKQAHKTWQSTATLIAVRVNSVTAAGGILVGPPLTPLIAANLIGTNASERKVVQAVALVVGNSWLSFSASVKVPGLPWYPAFAAVPSPIAPPTPNVPMPFAALTQAPALVSTGFMKPQIMAQLLPDKSADGIVESVLRAFEQYLILWRVSTLVTNVLGTGPVPTFAPPFVPMGPVVGGVGTMVPGGFV